MTLKEFKCGIKRDASAVKRTNCVSRDTGLDSQHTRVAHNCLELWFQEIRYTLLASLGTSHTYDTHVLTKHATYLKIKHSVESLRMFVLYIFLK